jgi:cell division topological specificity factor
MSWLTLIFGEKKSTASVAKERLQLIIAHERACSSGPDFLPELQKDLVAVISKYFPVNPEDIKVGLEKQGNYEVLEVNIVLPDGR